MRPVARHLVEGMLVDGLHRRAESLRRVNQLLVLARFLGVLLAVKGACSRSTLALTSWAAWRMENRYITMRGSSHAQRQWPDAHSAAQPGGGDQHASCTVERSVHTTHRVFSTTTSVLSVPHARSAPLG